MLRCGPGHVYGEERTPGRGQIRCGRLKSETNCRARVPEGWGRAGGPRVSWGLGPFVLGVDLA